MRKIAFILSFLFATISTSYAQLQISGKLRSLKPTTKITLKDMDGTIILSHEIEKGKEYKTKKVNISPDLYTLIVETKEIPILLKNEPVVISGFYNNGDEKLSEILIEKAPQHEQYAAFMRTFPTVKERIKTMNDYLKENPTVEQQLIALAVTSAHIDYFPFEYEFFASLLQKCENVKKTKVYSIISKVVENNYQFAIGAPAFDFTAKDIDDKSYKLSNFKGKMVLVDFWASWCGPCRAEMKSLQAIYEELKGDDLQFISLSLDDTKEKWMKALEEDKIPWLALFEDVKDKKSKTTPGFYDSVIRPKYGFRQIPFIVLIDKEGKTVKRFLRGEDVKTAIETLRKK